MARNKHLIDARRRAVAKDAADAIGEEDASSIQDRDRERLLQRQPCAASIGVVPPLRALLAARAPPLPLPHPTPPNTHKQRSGVAKATHRVGRA